MTMLMNPETGEVYSNYQNKIDYLISMIKYFDSQCLEYKKCAFDAKQELLAMAQFRDGIKTSRIKGEKYIAKVEIPSKVSWNQKELESIFNEHHLQPAISIASYKVDMREYKKMINTVGDESFNALKERLMKANLGSTGSPKITIEEIKNSCS